MTDRPHAIADTLDRAWDDHRPGDDPLLDRLMALGNVDAEADRRVRARFLALTAPGHVAVAGPPMPAAGPALPRPRTSPPQHHQQRWLSWRFITGVAVGTALFLLLGIAIGTWLRSDLGPTGLRQELAALVGLESRHWAGESMNAAILLTPGEQSTGEIDVSAWLVTLAPGTEFALPTDGDAFGKHPVDVQLLSGELSIIATGSTVTIPGPGERWSGPLVGEILGYRNASGEPVKLLVLGPNEIESTFGAGVEAKRIMGIVASASTGHQVQVVVAELNETSFVRRLSQGIASQPGVDRPYRFVFIDRGSVVGEDGAIYGAGSTIDLHTTPASSLSILNTSGNEVRAFALGISPFADNQTLDQQVESIAPENMGFPIAADGSVSIAVRELTVPTGSSVSFPSAAIVGYGVTGGTGVLAAAGFGHTEDVAEGAVVMQGDGSVLTFEATGSDDLMLIQVLVGNSAAVEDTLRLALPPGVEPAHSRTFHERLAGESGQLRMRLSRDGGGQGGANAPVSFIVPLDGPIFVGTTSGTAHVERGNGSTTDNLTTNELTHVAPGDVYVGAPGATWYVDDQSGGHLFAVLSLQGVHDPETPITEVGDGTPVGTFAITGDPNRCTVAPLTIADIDRLHSVPVTATPAIERSTRNQTGTPIDDATRSEILTTLQAYVDCASTGDSALSATFFSDQALREQPTVRENLSSDRAGVVAPIDATVADIILLPDGRVGARFMFGGEYAYLTLVKQDGTWKIDVWDDRIDPATPAASG